MATVSYKGVVFMVTKVYPACTFCGGSFGPADSWHGSNFCRAAFLLEFIEEHPGLSAWEIAQQSDMPYAGVTRGLAKAREWELLDCAPEDREQGGIRYRYTVVHGWSATIQTWLKRSLI